MLPSSLPPPSNAPPEKAVGIRIELSWHERLYSPLRVLKWQPWLDIHAHTRSYKCLSHRENGPEYGRRLF